MSAHDDDQASLAAAQRDVEQQRLKAKADLVAMRAEARKWPTPSVGRIVHYQSYGTPNGEYLPEARAAFITEVAPECGTEPTCDVEHIGCPRVSVAVINPTGLFFKEDMPFAETPTPGHWNWPPRVD